MVIPALSNFKSPLEFVVMVFLTTSGVVFKDDVSVFITYHHYYNVASQVHLTVAMFSLNNFKTLTLSLQYVESKTAFSSLC